MRSNDSAQLVCVTRAQGEDGSFSEARRARTVFVNRRSMGATSFMAARSAGLHADAEVQLRTCDYAGEGLLVMGGAEFSVERAREQGDYTLLTLARRLRNG